MLNEHLMDVPAPESSIPGIASVALIVRYPGEDEAIRCGVQAGVTPRAMWDGIALLDMGHVLVGVHAARTSS